MGIKDPVPLPFAGGFYQSSSKKLSMQDCINWVPHHSEAAAANPENLFASPGIDEVSAGAPGADRGGIRVNGTPYFVSGSILYRLDRTVNADLSEAFTRVSLGTIEGSKRVIMAKNKRQLCIIVPGEKAYGYDEVGTLQEITDAAFDGPVDDVKAVDSYFVFCKTGTNKVFHSQLNDVYSYNALDFTIVNQLEQAIGLTVFRNQLYVHGLNKTVPFSNVGGLEFAFQVIPNAVIDYGLITALAKTNTRSSLVFVGGSENSEAGIWRYSGGEPTKISTTPIDKLIQGMSAEQLDRAFMMRLSQDGGEFLTITVGDFCLVYDVIESQKVGRHVWHRRQSHISTDGNVLVYPWRVTSIVQAYNSVFVGDALDSRIGRIDDKKGDEYGQKIRRRVVLQPFGRLGADSKVQAIQAYFDADGEDNQSLYLSWSDDGHNFKKQLKRNLGAVGEYGRKTIWNRLGGFPNTRTVAFDYFGSGVPTFIRITASLR